MPDDALVRMANQIAANFEAYPEEEARAGVAEHIARFWDPRMRAGLRAVAASRPEALHPLARAAAEAVQPAGD